MEFMQLETPRLILRKFESSDLDFVFNHFRDEFVSLYLYDNEPPEDMNEAQEILDWCMDIKGDHLRWCLVLKETEEPIGTIGYHRYDSQNNSAEIGYDLSESQTRKGLMTEALQSIIQYGSEALSLHRIHASVALKNLASNKLLESNDFQLEGVIRDQYYFRGQYYDHNLWSHII